MASIDDLAASLASNMPLTQQEGRVAVRVLVSAIVEALVKGESLAIPGMGRITPNVTTTHPDGSALVAATIKMKYQPVSRLDDPFLNRTASLTAIEIYLNQAQGKTHPDRWRLLAPGSSKVWEKRARIAASYVVGRVVVDLGCGQMLVERHLPEDTRYTPYDVVRHDERTIVVDLNAEDVPSFSADTCFMLGVLGYIARPDDVIKALISRCTRLIVSYYKRQDPQIGDLFMPWVVQADFADFEQMLTDAGWQITLVNDLDSVTTRLYVCDAPSPNREHRGATDAAR